MEISDDEDQNIQIEPESQDDDENLQVCSYNDDISSNSLFDF